MTRGGKSVSLGNFATAEEAALCVVRSLEGQAAAQKAAAAPPLTSEGAQRQAQAEGLTLRVADSTCATGYFGVYLPRPDTPKPYKAQVKRGGKSAWAAGSGVLSRRVGDLRCARRRRRRRRG